MTSFYKMSLRSLFMTNRQLLLVLLAVISSSCFADRGLGLGDWHRTQVYYQNCLNFKKIVIKERYSVECYTNYHHFNADSVSKFYKKSNGAGKYVEIGSFNLLHPGSRATDYKDYRIIAKIINGYDIVSGMELLPVISRDAVNNANVATFVAQLKIKIAALANNTSSEAQAQLKKLNVKLEKVRRLYRQPAYLKLLDQLRMLDPSWSLLLAPSGEAADERYNQELVGFFYRGSKVRPKINEHCLKFKKKSHGTSFACYPKLTKAWFGKSIRRVFSRRPFLGSFESGDFDFTILTSHIVFNSPSDAAGMERILMPSFGVKDYKKIGSGANKGNYARWAEMKVILEMMNKIRSESNEKDIFFLGDTNLESSNYQWSKILKNFPGGKLFVDTPTTLSPKRFLIDGSETNGMASDYDHVVMDISETSECVKNNGDLAARVGNFIKGNIRTVIDKEYRYRIRGTNQIDISREVKRKMKIGQFTNVLENTLTVKGDVIKVEETDIKGRVNNYNSRIFKQQLDNNNYYRYFREVISDHFPIYFSCKG